MYLRESISLSSKKSRSKKCVLKYPKNKYLGLIKLKYRLKIQIQKKN